MKEIFEKWYATHDPSGNQPRLEHRLAVLKKTNEDDSAPHVFDFLNLTLNENGASRDVFEYFAKKVKEHEGESFTVSDNEARVLACGAILFFSQQGAWPARLKTNLSLSMLRIQERMPDRVIELSEASTRALTEASISSRAARFNGVLLKKAIEAATQDLKQHAQNITSQGESISKAIQALHTATSALSSDVGSVREENQLLWWLKAASLKTLDAELADIPQANRIICAAYDLTKISLYYSLPASAQQFALEAFQHGDDSRPSKKTVSIKSIVEGISNAHASIILEDFANVSVDHHHIFPILSTLQSAHEYAQSKGFDKTKVPSSARFSKLSFKTDQAIELALCETSLAKLESEQ